MKRATATWTTGSARGYTRDPGRDAEVLLVEDDLPAAKAICRTLERQEFRVQLAYRSEQAIFEISKKPYDLVILDLGLSGLSGLDVLKNLRDAGERMPVLVLSARDSMGSRVRALDLGADHCMGKPFDATELTARARALVRRNQADVSSRVEYGPLVFDKASQRAFVGETPLRLGRREWVVLALLLERVGRVVHKASLVEAIASAGGRLSMNAVEVYVSRLRAKLKQTEINIRTIHQLGYTLELRAKTASGRIQSICEAL